MLRLDPGARAVRAGQLGWIADYNEFLDQLDAVWRVCHRARTRRATYLRGGRRLPVAVQERRAAYRGPLARLHSGPVPRTRVRQPVTDHLAQIANAVHEVERGTSGFLGKPYEPNAVIKNYVEFILMQRKPGGYRRPSLAARTLSLLSEASFKKLLRQVWTDIAGASTRDHPAPYPVALADRLIRMFSFVGDCVFDPFTGTASTQIAAAACGRNSIGIEVDPVYYERALTRLRNDTASLLSTADVTASTIDPKCGWPATA